MKEFLQHPRFLPKLRSKHSVLVMLCFLTISSIAFAVPSLAHASVVGDVLGYVGKVTVLGPIAAISFLFLTLASALTWISGVLLNLALYNGVVNFAGSIGGTSGIGIGWGVLRDIGNIVLIFSFVFIGIATILGLESYGVKKSLPQLLLFAVLLNFSLLASQVIIDSSNLISVAVYSNINSGASTACQGITSQADCFINEGLAGAVGTATKIGTLYSIGTIGSFFSDPGQTTVAIIMATIFLLITATVFFAAAILLIIRIVVLVFLMVLSPIGFAGMALPPLHKYASQWWNMLLAQSFFVPVYLVLTLVGLKVGEGVASLSGANGSLLEALTTGKTSSSSVFLTFAIIIGFMIAALLSAKKLGAMGADLAISKAGSLAFGTTAFIARRTGGRALNYGAKRLEKSGWARRHPLLGSVAFKALDKGATGNWDVRGAAGGMLKAGGLDLGEVRKGGYRKEEEEAEKIKIERGKRLKNTEEEEVILGKKRKERNEEESRHDAALDALERAKITATKEQVEAINKQIIEENLNNKKKLAAIDKVIDNYGRAPILGLKDEEGNQIKGKEGYAEALRKPVPVVEWIYKASGPGRVADNAAAKKLETEAKKKKTDKDFDSVMDALKKAGSASGTTKP